MGPTETDVAEALVVAVTETPRTGFAAAGDAKADRAMATTEMRASILMSNAGIELEFGVVESGRC